MEQEEFQKRIGRNIRIARRLRFHTYRGLAKLLGVTHPTLRLWEIGATAIPLYYIYKLSLLLGISMHLLLVLDEIEDDEEKY